MLCPHDLKNTFLNTIRPDLVNIINNCLLTGTVPDCFKLASVTPIPKKPSPDPEVYSNFRPISNLPFLSKNLEKNSVYADAKLFE